MKKILDLSIPINNHMPFYPGDPKPQIGAHITIEQDGCQVMELHIGTHTGTHMDAPRHFLAGGACVDQIPLERCMGKALIITLPDLEENHPICPMDIQEYLPKLATCEVVLIHTGWMNRYGSESFYHHPYLSHDLAELLASYPIKAVGVDMLNVDRTHTNGEAYEMEAFYAHDILLNKEIIIIENLIHLELADFQNPYCVFFPLNIEGGDGSPVRAVLMEEQLSED